MEKVVDEGVWQHWHWYWYWHWLHSIDTPPTVTHLQVASDEDIRKIN